MPSSAGRLSCTSIAGIDAAYEVFGGVRVWAPSERVLREGLEEIQVGIEAALAQHSSLDKDGLVFVLGQLIGERIDWRVLGAILGRELRRGAVEEVLCSSTSNRVFRVYIAADVRDRFYRRLADAVDLLRLRRQLKVAVLQDRMFGTDAPKGTWTQAAHVVAHMVFRGTAIYLDAHQFVWPTGLENAFR